MKIYKQQLLNTLVEKLGEEYSKKVVSTVVETFVETVRESLEKGDAVSLPKLGTFTSKERAERDMKHPMTGEYIKVPQHVVPVFKAARSLRQMLRAR